MIMRSRGSWLHWFHWNANKVCCFLIWRQFLWFHALHTSMKFLRDFYFADLRFFEVSGNIGVGAEGRWGGRNPKFRKFWNFSGKMLLIRATADGVDDKLKKKKKKENNNDSYSQTSHLDLACAHLASFFPAVSILSWKLRWELHLSVETVLRLNPKLLNPISHFAVPVCHWGKPSPRSTRLQALVGEKTKTSMLLLRRDRNPEDYHRVNTFFTFLDKILAEIENRFSANEQDVLCALDDITLRYHFRTTPQEKWPVFDKFLILLDQVDCQ